MGLPVDIPGLNTVLPEVPDGKVAIVEGGTDGAKGYFARQIAKSALRLGRPVTYLTSRDGPEITKELQNGGGDGSVRSGMLRVEELDSLANNDGLHPAGGLLAIDSFSFLTLDLPLIRLAEMMRGLHTQCSRTGLAVLLATDRGMFDPRAEAITIHLSDGLIQFHSKEGPEGVIRYLRVPKWSSGTVTDRNIYYEFDGTKMVIDLRRRVL
jgi:KaiC/GvpD/RAD55 family RecA-like ATPase